MGTAETGGGMKIDIGSGGYRKDGFLGMDVVASPGTDIVCDIERERWPLADDSVDAFFSSHCFEHIRSENMPHLLKEISRTARDGCRVEFWHPYGFHRDATLMGHINPITEADYYHIAVLHREAWAPSLGAAWCLTEVRYHVSVPVRKRFEKMKVPIDFAIDHHVNVVMELGVFAFLDKSGRVARDPMDFRRTVADHVPGTDVRETRDLNVVEIGTGPGSSAW